MQEAKTCQHELFPCPTGMENKTVTTIGIPPVINGCNHWMEGVNKADQCMLHCRPNLRCRRTWMPIMFHALDCMHSNAFVASKKLGYKGVHKDFVMEWCQALRCHAVSDEVAMTRRARQQREDPIVISSAQKNGRCMSHTNPELLEYQLQGPREEHHPVPVKGKQRTCMHCAYLSAPQKAANGPAISMCVVTICARNTGMISISGKKKQQQRQMCSKLPWSIFLCHTFLPCWTKEMFLL